MKRTVMLSSLMALVVIVAFSIFLATRHPVTGASEEPSPLLGQAAPALRGPLLGEKGTSSLAAYRGKIVVVNFWASWCGPCQAEAPDLSTFAWANRHRNVAVIGVVFNDTVSAAENFAVHYGSLYPSIIDPGGVLANRYGVTSPPTTFVISATGRVEATLLGPVTTAQLSAVVARVRS